MNLIFIVSSFSNYLYKTFYYKKINFKKYNFLNYCKLTIILIIKKLFLNYVLLFDLLISIFLNNL